MRFFFTIFISILLISLLLVSISLQIPLSKVEEDNNLIGIILIQDKLLEGLGQKRIILLGGSSLGLGVSARMITARTGLQTINTGRRGGLGYGNIWDLYSPYFDKTQDLIVISPEAEMITSGGRPLGFAICEMSTLKLTDWKTNLLCSGRHAKRVIKKMIGFRETKSHYSKSDFDEFGDSSVELIPRSPFGRVTRRCDEMPSKKQFDDYLRFFEDKKLLGYNILYIPSIIFKDACISYLPRILELNTVLTEAFGSELPDDYPYLLEEKYFMDTIHHLTPDGRKIKTEAFLQLIKARLAFTQQ
ncbi:MAG: hypothetical protein O2962_07805 [Cyanobacteria bacterium]|nr:hypothetical protein [Cyanobacteriota bacterium]